MGKLSANATAVGSVAAGNKNLTADLYQENAENAASILLLNNVNDQIIEQISATHFSDDLQIEVLALLFEQQLSQHSQQLNFLVGRVNFATLLPMRAIPFKVICLLGMNEADFLANNKSIALI